MRKAVRISVHPRVGGEQRATPRPPAACRGSSPRGRGTGLQQTAGWQMGRFIPAWAGNRARIAGNSAAEPVHPRVGGEQTGGSMATTMRAGSSPRGRGTVIHAGFFPRADRFIPAWAGNRTPTDRKTNMSPVHPRVGGEQTAGQRGFLAVPGSSPRGRGTGFSPHGADAVPRFIPAWAGNSSAKPQWTACPPVHPRVGGEQQRARAASFGSIGSSPRGRGTVALGSQDRAMLRFIPAWAGNSSVQPPRPGRCPVHPRVGGEQLRLLRYALAKSGSSPRGRGTVVVPEGPGGDDRFIPAWAGNRARGASLAMSHAVHPRVGGEQGSPAPAPDARPGSSPRGRGTAGAKARRINNRRFIPAWAGNSRPAGSPCAVGAVHPRVGGEQLMVRRSRP